MNDSFLSSSVVFLPFDILSSGSGWILSRGVHQLVLNGKNASRLINVLQKYTHYQSVDISAILIQYPKSLRLDALQLLFELYQRKFLVPASSRTTGSKESSEDLFYWHFHTNKEEVVEKLKKFPLAIVGINQLSIKLYHSLVEYGFSSLEFIDDPSFRSEDRLSPNADLKIGTVDSWEKNNKSTKCRCIVACADAGGALLLSDWNRYCIEKKIPFFPIYIYQLVGYVGPWIWPGETACLECLIQRKNALLAADEIALLIESNASTAKKNSAYISPLINLCAELAAFEIGAHATELSIRRYNSQLSINLFNRTTSSNKILKLPRCTVCSSLNYHGAHSPLKQKL